MDLREDFRFVSVCPDVIPDRIQGRIDIEDPAVRTVRDRSAALPVTIQRFIDLDNRSRFIQQDRDCRQILIPQSLREPDIPEQFTAEQFVAGTVVDGDQLRRLPDIGTGKLSARPSVGLSAP